MDVGGYLSLLRRHWIVILALGLLAGAGGYAYAGTLPPEYRATVSLHVSFPRGESVSELVQGTTYARTQVETLALLSRMPVVLDPVIDRLELSSSSRALGRTISASSPLDTSILEVTAVSTSPQQAADVANAVGDELAVVIADLESAAAGRGIQVTTVAPAVPPRQPFAPNTRLITATALAAGLGLGVLLALARTVLDTRVRTEDDVRRLTAATVLTTVRQDRGVRPSTVVMRENPFGDRAEAYRRLRTNLRFLGLGTTVGGSVVVTSALPGEGKSTTSMNLAIALAERDLRVLLVDADLRRPSLAEHAGLDGTVGLSTVLIGDATLDQVVQPWGGAALHVLAAGQIPPNPSELLDSPAMVELLTAARRDYDVVVLDSAPLLPVTDAAVLARLTDGALVVVGLHKVRRHQLTAALHNLDAAGGRLLGVVLNRARGGRDGQYSYRYQREEPGARRRGPRSGPRWMVVSAPAHARETEDEHRPPGVKDAAV